VIVAYKPAWESKQEIDDTRPKVFVGVSGGNVLLMLTTSDFEVSYVDGKAAISLSRNLSAEEAHDLGVALMNYSASQPGKSAEDNVCPTCEGSGVF